MFYADTIKFPQNSNFLTYIYIFATEDEVKSEFAKIRPISKSVKITFRQKK